MQRPATHRCPGAHAAPPPHRHSPPTHASALPATQGSQRSPSTPQLSTLIGLHVDPVQHPSGQIVASHSPAHTPPTHAPLHASQALPPAPHAELASPGRHAPPASQHPKGQDVVSHTHTSASHRCPSAQVTSPHSGAHTDGAPVHVHPGSIVQPTEHPSPSARPMSSHSSKPSVRTPSPQVGGSPRCTASTTTSRRTSAIPLDPAATSAPPRRPVTRTQYHPSASGKSTTRSSPSGDSARGGSGRVTGSRGPASVQPSTSSWSTSTSYVTTKRTPVSPPSTGAVQPPSSASATVASARLIADRSPPGSRSAARAPGSRPPRRGSPPPPRPRRR